MSANTENVTAAGGGNTSSSSAQANPAYIQAAHRTASTLMNEFPAYPTYWQLGHTLDTLNDYFFQFLASKEATDFAAVVLEKFLNRGVRPWVGNDTGRDPWWYDDFGWWGIAALRAGARPDIYGTRNAAFLVGVAELSWQPMYRNAPNVWLNAKWNKDWEKFEPRFEGGVWNYFFSDREIVGTPFTPGWPGGQDSLRCIQNTVTNALYWIMMARLAQQRSGEPEFRQAADAAWGFFNDWFTVRDGAGLLYYFDRDDPNRAVVRERVPTYKSGETTWAYDSRLAWTGDQGLVLAALVDQMKLAGADARKAAALRELAQRVAGGVIGYLVDPQTRELWPWAPYSGKDRNCPGGDCVDYLTGVGVFMRQLLYADRADTALRVSLREMGYPVVVKANADLVLKNPGTSFIERTNDLAILLAAIGMGVP